MYEKSSFKYRTVNHDVSDNKINFYGRTDIFKHHMSALNWRKNADSDKARDILILILFHFLFKDTLVFAYKKFR